jgi:hypothetical protein
VGSLKPRSPLDPSRHSRHLGTFIMATFTDTTIPRKRMATYGKAARKRISDYGVSSPAPKSEGPEPGQRQHSKSRSTSITPSESEKSENSARRYASKPHSPSPPLGGNVFDVPSSDDELAAPAPKPLSKMPAKMAKFTATRRILPIYLSRR